MKHTEELNLTEGKVTLIVLKTLTILLLVLFTFIVGYHIGVGVTLADNSLSKLEPIPVGLEVLHYGK